MPDSIEEYDDTQVCHACEELFERSVHRTLSRMARFAPDTLVDMPTKLMESLDDPDPVICGHASEILGLSRAGMAEDKLESLKDDKTEYKLYDFETREFMHKSVGDAVSEALVALTREDGQ